LYLQKSDEQVASCPEERSDCTPANRPRVFSNVACWLAIAEKPLQRFLAHLSLVHYFVDHDHFLALQLLCNRTTTTHKSIQREIQQSIITSLVDSSKDEKILSQIKSHKVSYDTTTSNENQ